MPRITTQSRDLAKGIAFVSPWIVGFLLFTALPVGLSLYYSFCNYTLLQKPVLIGVDNYRDMVGDPTFWITIRNTAVYAVATLALCTVAAIGSAVLLNSKIRGQSIYRTIIFLPSLIPAVASAMLWLWLFNAKLGLINNGLRGIGIVNPPAWLNDTHWAMTALIVLSLWGIGNSVVIYLAGLQDVPRELYEAADVDGASPLRKLWHVTLPGISPVIFFNVIMGLIGTIQVFIIPYIVTQGGPERSTNFISMYLYENAFHYLKMGQASAIAWVQLVFILSLTAVATWSSKHWVHQSGK